MTRWAVFTDLDGTLLDASTYGFEAAGPALAEAARLGVPVVPCTTKTESETRHWAERLGLATAFIFENGGGAAVSMRGFPEPPLPFEERDGYRVVPLAVHGAPLQEGIRRIREATGGRAVFMSDLTEARIAEVTGLTPVLAALARRRMFDEPFACDVPFPGALVADLASLGLHLSRGGRFWHLHGDIDKGRTTRLVAGWLSAALGPLRIAGLGDSALDRPLLEASDTAIAIPRPDGSFDPELCSGLPGLVRAPAPGPAGWNRAVLDLLAGAAAPTA